MERHETHNLSNQSSSTINHSYNSNKGKVKINDLKEYNNPPEINLSQERRIRHILNKYNIKTKFPEHIQNWNRIEGNESTTQQKGQINLQNIKNSINSFSNINENMIFSYEPGNNNITDKIIDVSLRNNSNPVKSLINKDKRSNKKTSLYSIEFKKNTRESKMESIRKNLDQKKIFEKKLGRANRLYQIKKPKKFIVTKIYKTYYQIMNNDKLPILFINQKNDAYFMTKLIIKRDLKKEDEKDASSLPSSIISDTKKDTKIKSKNLNKRLINNKLNKKERKDSTNLKNKTNNKTNNLSLQKSISINSKKINEKSSKSIYKLNPKTIKIDNIKKRISNKENIEVNKDIRKNHFSEKYPKKFLKPINLDSRKDASNNLNISNDNKINEDFNIFLRNKRESQLKHFIKKNGINSYNFFYPREPSPLLSIFKNRYNIYPTLIEKKDIIEKKTIIIDNVHRKIFNKNNNLMKKIIGAKDKKQSKNKIEYKKENCSHTIKHYGNEKNCPICCAGYTKNLKDIYNITLKFKKNRINRLNSPKAHSFFNSTGKDGSFLYWKGKEKNKNNEFVDKERKKFIILYDYFNQ